MLAGIDAILPAVVLQQQKEHVEQVAQHLPPVVAFRQADSAQHLEQVQDAGKLLVGEREVVLVEIEEIVAIDIGVVTFHFLLKPHRHDDEHGMIVGRRLMGAEDVVGSQHGDVVPPEADRLHVALGTYPALKIEADSHVGSGVGLMIDWHPTDVVEYHQAALVYLFCQRVHGVRFVVFCHRHLMFCVQK